MPGKSRKKNLYLHADGDSFFVACELSVRPELRGCPVIVGADRGIAVAMSAEAKTLGVTRGMPVFQIKKLFPKVVILPHNFELYHTIATKMQEILSSYFTHIEEYSIDESFALAEPSELEYFGGEKELVSELKKDIESTLGVVYSLGLARTKALSKLASKLEKPGGMVVLLTPSDEARALKATSIEDIWGIGRRTVPRLKQLGMRTAYDFTIYPEKEIERDFSSPILTLQRELRGEEVLEVESDTDPRNQKSIQSTATFRPASGDSKVIWRELAENAEHACQSARVLRLVSDQVGFFVKTSEFKYYFDEAKLEEFTADPGQILNAIEAKFPKLLPANKKARIRSTGVILHNLVREEKTPRDLFGNQEKAIKRLLVEQAADRIREKHGSGAIRRGSSLPPRKK